MPSKAKPANSPADSDSFPQALKRQFRDLLFGSASDSEVEGLSEADLDRLADLAFRAFAVRLPGTHSVNVGAGEGEVGHRHMAVALSTDDMPFLVDSATAAIGGFGLEIQRLFHPVNIDFLGGRAKLQRVAVPDHHVAVPQDRHFAG